MNFESSVLLFCLRIVFFILTSVSLHSQCEFICDLHEGYSINELLRHQRKSTGQRIEKTEYKCLSQSQNIWLVTCENDNYLSFFSNHPAVQSAQLNYPLEFRSEPNDILLKNQWQYFNKGINGEVDADIDMLEAWDLTTGGKTYDDDEIVVAVIDGGVDILHPDLENNIWINKEEIPNNFIDDDKNGYIDDRFGWNFNENNSDIGNAGDGNWHGTPVTGIIGAEGNNGIGVSGINWNVKVLSLVANKSVADIIAAYDYIYNLRKIYNESKGKQGAFIVASNTSLGISNAFPIDHPIWCEMYNSLGSVGILSAVATTNRNTNVDINGDIPSNCTSDFLLTVTNIDEMDHKEISSGYGLNHIDVGAPGTNVYTTLNKGKYGLFGGTSAASPHVAGVIALMYSIPSSRFIKRVQQAPYESSLHIKHILLQTVDKIEDMKRRSVSEGRINAYKALKALYEHYHQEIGGKDQSGLIIKTYPVPTNDILTIDFNMNKRLSCVHENPENIKKRIIINLVDNLGNRIIHNRKINIDEGKHSMELDLTSYPNGVYFLNIHSEEFFFSKSIKIVKAGSQ